VIEYTVLGTVTAWEDGRALSLLPQHRLLLARLVIAGGKPVARADLVDTLWENDDDSGPPDHALVRVVSELRNRLRGGPDGPDLVPPKGDGYYLQLSPRQADVLRFWAKVRAAEGKPELEAVAMLRDATSEWGEGTGLSGGPTLGGLAGTWAASVRQQLGQEYREARLACLRHDLIEWENERVADECRRLATEPEALHSEPFVEYWMIAAYRSSSRGRLAALGIYERAESAVRADLDASLSERLRRLAELIRTEDPALDGPDDPLDWARAGSRGTHSGPKAARAGRFTVNFKNAAGSSVENQIGYVENLTRYGPTRPDSQA
jgi:DNA-binding SARP family transcriptional activator